MSIKEFEKGKTYRWIGPQDFSDDWAPAMEDWKDGKPRLCTSGGKRASFKDIKNNPWSYSHCLEHFEEVTIVSKPKKKYTPIEGFVSGKWYVYHGTEPEGNWNHDGEMDFVLDGKPHLCTDGYSKRATFYDDGKSWLWGDLSLWEEVPGPKKEEKPLTVARVKTKVERTPLTRSKRRRSAIEKINTNF